MYKDSTKRIKMKMLIDIDITDSRYFDLLLSWRHSGWIDLWDSVWTWCHCSMMFGHSNGISLCQLRMKEISSFYVP